MFEADGLHKKAAITVRRSGTRQVKTNSAYTRYPRYLRIEESIDILDP